jgi:hypothetical protein
MTVIMRKTGVVEWHHPLQAIRGLLHRTSGRTVQRAA